ncbi:hypothetical protein DBV15_06262 [Temnothorax longispinosus]|uniref:Uncharacterized protein n=1 Tax=Temnothorax longispinosus TaxID=300112 RepID=A0A4S2KWC4_9HYME|nr:hypothetical protein DBV15_06262 [Temnothorax longispinosus]
MSKGGRIVHTLVFLLKLLSNRKSNAIKIPGNTMSPNPNMAKLSAFKPFSKRSCGNTSLMGTSKDFATVTITSVPNTQKASRYQAPTNEQQMRHTMS